MKTDKLLGLAVSKNGFVFDPENGSSYTLNDTGLFILQQIQSGNDKSAVLEKMINEYEVTMDLAQSDFEHFVAMLKSLDLVEA